MAKKSHGDIIGFRESNPNRNVLAYNILLAFLIMEKGKGEVVSGTIVDRQTEIEVIEITKGGEEDVHSS